MNSISTITRLMAIGYMGRHPTPVIPIDTTNQLQFGVVERKTLADMPKGNFQIKSEHIAKQTSYHLRINGWRNYHGK